MSDISKLAVYDPRIVQDPPKYAVQKGALSISTSTFAANSASPSSLSFQVLVPSLNVFVDRKVELSAGVTVYLEAVSSQSIYYDTTPPVVPGGTLADPSYTIAPPPVGTLYNPNVVHETTFPPVKPSVDRAIPGAVVNQALMLPKGSFAAGGTTWLGTDSNTYIPAVSPQDICLSMFPLQTMCSSVTATVNDCSVSMVGDTLHEQLLLAQSTQSRKQRTCPSKTDYYAWGDDDCRAANGQLQGISYGDEGDLPNGSYPVQFVNPNNGNALARFDAYQAVNSSGVTVTVYVINGRPCWIPRDSGLRGLTFTAPNYGGTVTIAASDAGPTAQMPLMMKFQTVEPLCISPFLWQDAKQFEEVGLYGVTNMTVNMNLLPAGPSQGYDLLAYPTATDNWRVAYVDKFNQAGSFAPLIRASGFNSLYSNIKLAPPFSQTTSQNGPWIDPKLVVTFLTPPPQIALPPVSTVPYSEFPRYVSSDSVLFSTGNVTVKSNTISLSSIPDLLMVYIKSNYRGQTHMDHYMPIKNIQVTFDNYANLCANFTQEDLYGCTLASGIDMDFDQFRGYATNYLHSLTPLSTGTFGSKFDDEQFTAPRTQLSGCPTVLRMGQDIPLSNGLAPGTLGNYSIQVTATVDNSSGFFNYLNSISTTNNVSITIVAVNSGFFETIKGSSAIRKTILNTVDVQSASMSSDITTTALSRLSGAGSMQSSADLTKKWKGVAPVAGDMGRKRLGAQLM